LSLTPDDADVHLWRASLDTAAVAHVALLESTLSSDERERAERYRFARDRVRYVVARGTLRAILGRYLGLAPAHLRFVYGPQGKPALALEHGRGISFNLSHAGDVALYAVTHGRRVGVDIEQVAPDVAGSTVPEHTFSPREVATLRALPLHEQTGAFFRCWTRKEAYVKALGAGFSLDLTSFDVSLAPGDIPALLATRPDPTEAAHWSLYDVDVGSGYTAALAVEGHDLVVTKIATNFYPDHDTLLELP
jgi:4'-phosphopantetheinyl transferase